MSPARVRLTGGSDYGLVRQYFGLVGYPPHPKGDPHRAVRDRFVRYQTYRLAALLPDEPRPAELRHPPLPKEIDSANRKGLDHVTHAIGAAWMALSVVFNRGKGPDPDVEWERQNVTYAALRLAELVKAMKTGTDEEGGEPAYMLRRWKRARPILHLALPLLELEQTGAAREAPELVAALPGRPPTFDACLLDPTWVRPALERSEEWRRVLPEIKGFRISPGDLVEVQYFNIPVVGNSRHR